MNIKHNKVATVTDSGDGKVSSNAWNESHVLTGTANTLVGFDANGAGTEIVTVPNITQTGAIGDNVTDDHTAIAASLSLAQSLATTGFGYSVGAGVVRVPKGSYYAAANTFDIYSSMRFEGDGGSIGAGGSSVIRWGAGAGGLRVQRYNTSTATGASNGHANDGTLGGDGTIISGLYLQGAYTATEGEFYGTQLRAAGVIRDTFYDKWQGDAIRVTATIGGNPEGAANCFQINNAFAQSCRNGLYVDGADANAGLISGFSAISNRQWGVWDSSFLGNTYVGCHTAANGLSGDGTADKPASASSYLGNRFYVKAGQETGASTNAPPATQTSNTWWGFWQAGAATTGIVAWTSGLTWRAGGSYGSDDANACHVLLGCYAESDQAPPQLSSKTLVLGGALAEFAGYGAGGAYIRAYGNRVRVNDFWSEGSVQADGIASVFGPTSGAAADPVTTFYTTNVHHTLTGKTSAGSTIGQVDFHSGFGVDIYGSARIALGINGVGDTAYITSTGVNLASGSLTYSVNGTQVVAARQTGWAVDTGTAKKTANATYAVGAGLTVSAAYVQAEVTAIITRQALIEAALRDATQTIKALKDALHGTAGHGLIGT